MSIAVHNHAGASLVLMNDFQAQWIAIRENVLAAVERVGKSGWLILGSEVKQFENLLAKYWGLTYAVGCASGLDALEIGLRCLDLQPGEKVLTTPLSAFATTLAIIRAGGVPVFVDVDSSGLIDLALCHDVLKQIPDIRYFVPVHLYGHALPMQYLEEIKKTYKLQIVEDCAQAIGAKSAGRNVGSVGDIAATSFYPTKNLGCMGDGGALLMQNESNYIFAKCLRDYGQSDKYHHTVLGMNSRLDELQAAILSNALLPKLNEFTLRRQCIATYYQQNIQHPLIMIPPQPPHSESVWHLFPVLITEHRAEFQECLYQLGIQSSTHYPLLIPEQTALISSQIKCINASELTRAKYFAAHEISLPIHPFMSDSDVERVIHACNSWRAN